jgi:DNA-binding PadR family transcriptional regulator
MSKELSNFGLNWLKNLKRSYIQMLIIFILFVESDITGYVITENLKSRIGLLFTISAGSVYPQLNKLEEDGIIYSETKNIDMAYIRPNEPRKVYNLTKYGLSIIKEIESLWYELIALTNTYLDEIRIIKKEGN